MDRLTDLQTSAPRTRPDQNDLARAKNVQPRRDDEVERKSSERTETRTRADRKQERPERFTVKVDEPAPRQAPIETPANQAEITAESSSKDAEAVKTDAQDARPATANTQAKQAQSVPEPKVAKTELALPEAAQAAAKHDQQDAPAVAPQAPLRIPPAVEVATVAAAAPKAEPLAVNAKAPKPAAQSDASATDALATATKPVETRPNPHAGATSVPTTTPKVQVEPKALDVARETQSTRPAHDVERAADILRQVRVQLSPHINEAHIQLQPLELGRISIRVSVEEGRMRTVVRAEKQEALDAIQTHLPELRAALRQQGIESQDFQLSLGLDQRSQKNGDDKPARANKPSISAIDTNKPEHALLLRATANASGIDLYA